MAIDKKDKGTFDLFEREQAVKNFLKRNSVKSNKKDFIKDSEYTRLVVVGSSGRIIDRNGVKIQLSVQDDGKTLKIFMED